MFITGSIIAASCLYNLGKEFLEHEQKKTKILAEKLTSSPATSSEKEASIKSQIAEIIAPFTDKIDTRDQQLIELTNPNKIEEYQKLDNYIFTSKLALATSLAGVLFPPFRIAALGVLLWNALDIYRSAYADLSKERKVGSDMMDAVAMTAIIGTGYFVIGSIGSVIYYWSKKLLLKTEDRSTKRLVNLFGEQPNKVWIVVNEIEAEIPFEELEKGNIISLNAGEMIPIDGCIVKGHALINQQSLTGESQPAEKGVGDSCLASTFIIEGHIHVKVAKAGNETVAAQIKEILFHSIDFKEVMTSRGKEVADKSALPILGISGLSIPFIGVLGGGALVNTSFSYILNLVSPMMVLNFLTIASQEGILVKDGRSMELLSKIDTVVFDKTGTLTLEQPQFCKIHLISALSENDLLRYAAAAEHRQNHPIALAIIQEAKERDLNIPEIDNAKYEVGYGIKVALNDKTIRLGSLRFMKMEAIDIPTTMLNIVEKGHKKGYSFVCIAIDQQLQGIIELHPTIRPEAIEVIQYLQSHHKACYIISGDHKEPTAYIAEQLGIKNYFAEVLPEDKAKLVNQLQEQNKTVCFIGDGINDSIALDKADISISLSGASTIATDTAQIVLMSGTLHQLPLLFHLGAQFEQHMKNNLKACIVPSVLTIGGIFFLHFGILAACISSQVSLMAGVGNSLHPMVTYQQAKLQKGKDNQNQPSQSELLSPPEEDLRNDEAEIVEQKETSYA
ncbi:MAG: heavy metal translocating P-type ATPase [Chitinophagales bacterium]